MSEEVVNMIHHHEKEIIGLKSDVKALEKDVIDLKTKSAQHTEQINSINRTLGAIEDNTQWIKRRITGAIITGVIGGVIAILFASW